MARLSRRAALWAWTISCATLMAVESSWTPPFAHEHTQPPPSPSCSWWGPRAGEWGQTDLSPVAAQLALELSCYSNRHDMVRVVFAVDQGKVTQVRSTAACIETTMHQRQVNIASALVDAGLPDRPALCALEVPLADAP